MQGARYFLDWTILAYVLHIVGVGTLGEAILYIGHID